MERNEYKKIILELINKNFPKLNTRIIFLTKGEFFWIDCFAITFYFILFSWIVVNPKMDKFPKYQSKAILTHELAHLDIIANKNFFEKIKFGFNWIFTKKGKINFERNADILVIKKGYGKGLLDRVKGIEKEYSKEKLKKRKLRGYLDSKQIKFYIKKYRKWQ